MKLKYILIISLLFILTACSDEDFYKVDSNMEFVDSQEVGNTQQLIFEGEGGSFASYALEYSDRNLSKILKKGEEYNVKYYVSNRGPSTNVISEIELVNK